MAKVAIIGPFQGEYRFLSNFYPSVVKLDGYDYPTVEHAYQAAKTFNAYDRERIKYAPTPGAAKRLGRQVEMRPDWNIVRVTVMRELVTQKFKNDALKQALINTGDAHLQEINTWGDTFWGVVVGRGGSNWLGRILMDVREEIK